MSFHRAAVIPDSHIEAPRIALLQMGLASALFAIGIAATCVPAQSTLSAGRGVTDKPWDNLDRGGHDFKNLHPSQVRPDR